jgi:hypothetical protein
LPFKFNLQRYTKVERIWMDSRAKMQVWALDYPAYLFLLAFNVVALYRFHVKPFLTRSTDKQIDDGHNAAVAFDWFLLLPVAYSVVGLYRLNQVDP